MPMTEYHPASVLQSTKPARPFALIILNGSIDGKLFQTLWRNSTVRVVADGGANHLIKAAPSLLPDAIVGDFDSVQPEVLLHYKEKGVLCHKDPDQYSTDLMKSSKMACSIMEKYLAADYKQDTVYDLVIFGGWGGRVDHSFHSLHFLYLCRQQQRRAYLLSEDCISFLLHSGTNHIYTPLSLLGKTCGIIPLQGEDVISTKGLEWDVENWTTSLGTQVSTSNHLLHDEVYVTCEGSNVLFTAEIRKSLDF